MRQETMIGPVYDAEMLRLKRTAAKVYAKRTRKSFAGGAGICIDDADEDAVQGTAILHS